MLGTQQRNNMAGEAGAINRQRVKLAEKILNKYGDEIQAVIRLKMKGESGASDILQGIFLNLVHKPIPEGVENIVGYLVRAIKNDIIDTVRHAANYRTRIHKYAELRKYKVVQEDPQNIVIQAEERQEIARLIDEHLPPHQAKAVILRFRHDQDTHDAAKRMGISERTYSVYLCEGLRKIRQFVRERKESD